MKFRELAVARIPGQATGTRPADRLALLIADPHSPLAASVNNWQATRKRQ